MNRLALAAALSAAALLASSAARAQDARESKKPAKVEEKKDAGQDAMMKAWAAAATPGEAHKKMEPMVGSWTAHTKMWMAPGAPPQESDGTAEFTSMLGGRFVEEKFQGTAMGQPFEGEGIFGYDNLKKKYVSTWVDNMGTMVMISTGNYDKAGKTLTMWSTVDDPVTRKPSKVKSVSTMPDADHMHFEMWSPDPSGKMFKTLEIVYTRKK